MSGFATISSPWICGTFDPWKFSDKHQPLRPSASQSSTPPQYYCRGLVCRSSLLGPPANGLDFVLHDALDSSGIDTTHARAAREGFCSQIQKLSSIERETSISINRGVDLGKTALYIAAEDDSLISHSSVPLPVDAFIERLDDHSMNFCSHYSSSFRSSPKNMIECLERYLYIDKGFRRTNARNQPEQRSLYLPSVLTHRLGSATMLSLIYSEILKMIRLWGLLDFDVEIFYPHDPYSLPRGYPKQESKESDQLHIMTSQSLFMEVGNAVTDNYYDNLGTVTYWWSHAMISDRTYHQLISTCDFTQQKESNQCETTYSYAMDQEFGNIDQYNIYAPPCNNSDGSTSSTRHKIRLPHRPHPIFRQISGYDPCTEKYAEAYYNRPDVQKALHANTTKIPYKWTACSEELNRNWNDTDVSILPIYRELIAAGLRIWVFSGDIDSVVPVTATRYSLAQLKLSTKVPWYPWYVKRQVGGWTEVYEGLTFATVRGAGHEVPLFKPRAALQLFKSFLRGEPLPKS